ncbi:related to Quercetin 2,3-dioxygenase [Phialocephala subalpina]|uniref:Related to Quercetin 2,3-dioxygenase n=1 Tax=Phialocephala subalpina TaxID=576137 RepID=A0A1L7XCW4_9HELO|nr:related to Quercetin 2,3-dioxygenase [Phialocephala subalpina]
MFYSFLFGAVAFGLAAAAHRGSYQIYRFPATGPSSDYAFSLIQTNALGSTALGVLPHLHEVHYENFFNFRGRFQLWTDKYDDENLHTPILRCLVSFNRADVDLFYALSSGDYTASTFTPYDPSANASSVGLSAGLIATLEGFDVYSQSTYSPRRDAVNGTAPANTTGCLHPYFVAKDYGPNYLNSQSEYQVIQPLVTGTQSANNFTPSTITMERVSSNATVPTRQFPGHAAFEVLEGSLQVEMLGEKVSLLQGDVVFIPGNTTYNYYSEVAYTKFLHVGQGAEGLDSVLIQGVESWDSPV